MRNVGEDGSGAVGGARSVSVGRAVWAWALAVVCWVAIMAAGLVSMIMFVIVGPSVVVDAGDETLRWLGEAWATAATVAATRVAGGALHRRGIRMVWALVLPGLLLVNPQLWPSGEVTPVDAVVMVATMAACAAAVTVWAPGDRRRRDTV